MRCGRDFRGARPPGSGCGGDPAHAKPRPQRVRTGLWGWKGALAGDARPRTRAWRCAAARSAFGVGSDFATDLSIRRSGIDPRTGSRYLEELAFEVVNEQSMPSMIARAHKLSACGVRRIFAVFVKKGEVCEWFPNQACFVPLDLDGTIEDRTLVCPVPVRALFDTAVADDSLVDALEAKGNPRLAERVATGFAEGRTAGIAEGLRKAVQTACTLLRIPLGPHERAHLDSLDADGLESLLVHLETERRWRSH